MTAIGEHFREGTIDLDDGRALGYAEYGEPGGAPILYLHGLPGSRLDPSLLDSEFQRLGARLVALERPGYGLSTARRSWRLLDWPPDVAAAADRLKIERFGLIGYSSGGKYAAACAYALPNRLTNTAIVSSVGPPATPRFREGLGRTDRLSMTLAIRARPLALAYWRIARAMAERRPESFLGQFEKELSEPDRAVFGEPEVRKLLLASSREALRAGAAGVVDDSAIQARAWGFGLEEIQAPVHLWHGDRDKIVPLHHSTYAAETIPTATLTVFEGMGHLVVSRFVEVAAALIR